MQEIAFATDTQLKDIARYSARKEFANSPKRKSEKKFANMLPVMDSFLYAATADGSLSQKVMAGGKQLKDWGIFIIAANLYNKAINRIVNKSETLQNFRDNSPVAYGVANTALGVTAGLSAVRWVNALGRKFIAPLIPQKAKDLAKAVAESTDTGTIGKAINNGMKNFATKYPKITKSLGFVGKWALPLLSLGYLASLAIDVFKTKSTEKKIYNELNNARLAAAQQLAVQNMQENTETAEAAKTSDAA